ncbi:MAG: alpha-ketoglutarate-dependent dioxygenase AlkB [Acidimicrobiaceae bacterium]|nr:alpha-ketoglutarate-dependent dioxygenase AlkB [Acidimicrobiaceae bacterium]
MPTIAHYQSNLFAQGQPSLRDQIEFHRIALDESSWIDLSPGWVQGADDLFASLHQELEWHGGSRPMYGKLVQEPRLHASLGDIDQRHPVIGAMKNSLIYRYGLGITAGFANLYRDGNDSVAWHADRIGSDEVDPIVAIVSLGAPRRFALRPMGGGSAERFVLNSGDLLVMGGACQHSWEHCVKPQANADPRISLSFRHVEDNPYSAPGHRSFLAR